MDLELDGYGLAWFLPSHSHRRPFRPRKYRVGAGPKTKTEAGIAGKDPMSKFARFGPVAKPRITKTAPKGAVYVDWKDVETLRRLMSPNGKIMGRKRLSASAAEQRMLSQAIKRARFMALLPFTSATV